MVDTDKPEFVRILVGLAAIKPGKGLTPEAIEIWWNAMREWPIADFRAASSELARTVEFMPSPFQYEQLRKAAEETAGEAWERVLTGKLLEPGSLADRAARTVGGQYAIRMANIEKDLPHIQRRFLESYESIRDAGAARQFLGLVELTRLTQAKLGA